MVIQLSSKEKLERAPSAVVGARRGGVLGQVPLQARGRREHGGAQVARERADAGECMFYQMRLEEKNKIFII